MAQGRAAHAATLPHTPQQFAQYQLHERIGRGGMGLLYRAMHMRLKRWVAIKMLPPDRMHDSQAIARFQREMEVVARLDHPNIVRALDAGETEGFHYLVMEMLEGHDLGKVLRAQNNLPVADACELVRQAAIGLQHAHENHLVHRDIKPSNLLLLAKGEVKILDLGLALLRGDKAIDSLTLEGDVMGSADYMAPEQWESCHSVDIRADIYSLGCTLHTLLVGHAPFGSKDYGSLYRKMRAHISVKPRNVAALRAEVPAAVANLLERMLAKDPADRPGSPAEIVRELQPHAQGADLHSLWSSSVSKMAKEGSTVSPSLSTGLNDTLPFQRNATVQVRKPRRWRRKGTIVAIALAVAAIASFTGWLAFSGGPGPSPDSPDAPKAERESAENASGPPGEVGNQAPRTGWQNLLARPPLKRVWKDSDRFIFGWNRERETLHLSTPTECLIALGQSDGPKFRLQIGSNQNGFGAYFGVYFGGHWNSEKGTFDYQLIQLKLYDANFRKYLLERANCEYHGPVKGTAHDGFVSSLLKRGVGGSEKLMELEVSGGKLRTVRWDGDLCPELTNRIKTDQWVNGRSCEGEFGVSLMMGTVDIRTARYIGK